MGAWGHLPFENDDASDFVSEFMDAQGFPLLFAGTDFVLMKQNEYLEAPDCSAAIAASEIVAAALGKPGGGIEEAVIRAAKKLGDPPADLVERCKRAVMRVQSNSELAELWSRNKELDHEWIASIDDLLSRLS
jgi:hypothetical protein